MRNLTEVELLEVSGSGNILKIGSIIIGYTLAFVAGGPAGLGIALATTAATVGVDTLDKMEEKRQQELANPLYNFNPHYDNEMIAYAGTYSY